MIVSFSGTGNSRDVALRLADRLGDQVTTIDRALLDSIAHGETIGLGKENRVIWVFPIYAWGLPRVVEKVMASARFETDAVAGPTLHWMVCTCGDDIGLAHRLWRKAMAARGFKAAGAFSVAMPNTYVFLPGFDLDSPEVANAKREAMPARTDHIAAVIRTCSPTAPDEVTEGGAPWIKSHILRPLFNRFLTSPRGFRVDRERCTGCGTCVRSCPLANINLVDRKPVWADDCTFCTACYHRCPEHAISWR